MKPRWHLGRTRLAMELLERYLDLRENTHPPTTALARLTRYSHKTRRRRSLHTTPGKAREPRPQMYRPTQGRIPLARRLALRHHRGTRSTPRHHSGTQHSQPGAAPHIGIAHTRARSCKKTPTTHTPLRNATWLTLTLSNNPQGWLGVNS